MNVFRLLISIMLTFLRNLFYSPKRIRLEINMLLERTLSVNASGKISTTDLVNMIFNFCQIYSGVSFYPYQEQFSKRLIRSVLENDGNEITALFSRQSGKSETVATTVGGMMIILPRLAQMPMFEQDDRISRFKDGLWVGIFAPTQRQAQITYNRMKTRLQCKSAIAVLSDPDFGYEFSTSNGQNVALTNGSFASAISASEGSNIEGESFKFIICEECQDISDYKIKKSIHPMGAAYNATIAKIGTATTFKGDFYEAIERNIADFKSGKIPIKNHFEYNYKVVMKYNKNYAKYIEKEKHRLGENSDEFQMAYNLKWILQRGMFIEVEKFEKLCGSADIERVQEDKNHIHTVGIDLAGSGDDSTVITILEVDWENPVICEARMNDDTGEEESYTAYNTRIKDWYEINNDDYEEQYPMIVDYLSHYKIARCLIDATRESSVAHRLRAHMPFEVVPFVFSTKSKSEIYKHLDGQIRSGRTQYPRDKDTLETPEYKKFIQQMAELQKGYSGSNMVVAHPNRRDAHDDYPDSWALAEYGAKERCDSIDIQVSDTNAFYKNTKISSFSKVRNRMTGRRR